MRSTLPAVMAFAALAAGCSLGPNPTNLAPATSPMGTPASLVVGGGALGATEAGELIAVREADVLLLTNRGLVRVPREVILGAEFEEAMPSRIQGAGRPSDWERVAHYSRYPLGLEGSQLAGFLRALDQAELIEVQR